MKIVKIIATLVIVAAGFGVNSAFSGNLDTFQKDFTKEMAKTQKEEKVNNEEVKKSKQEESKNEIVSEGNVEKNKGVSVQKETKAPKETKESEEKKDKPITEPQSNTQSTQIQEKTTTPNANNSSTPSVPEQQKPQTAWDKLGISEYEYYNTPLIAGDYKDFNNSSQCSRFLDIIESDLDLLGGYQDVLGKYTGGVIGCRIRIYIDGNVYSLSQFKNTQYYTNDIKSKIDAL